MTPGELEKAIASGNFENVYYFAGEEELLKKEAIDRIRTALLPMGLEALNETTLDSVEAQTIIDNAILMPVMCDRRIVIVKDWHPFEATKNDGADDKDAETVGGGTQKKPAAEMRKWLSEAPDSCTIIFTFTKKPKAYLAKEKGYVDFAHLQGNALREVCERFLGSYGKTLRGDAFEELTMMAGTDLTRLYMELDKLAAYTGRSKNITVADVKAVATPSPEYSVFNILDQLLGNNIGEATKILNSLLKHNDVTPTSVIAMFTSSMRIYLLLKLADENGGISENLQKTLGVSDGRKRFVMGRFKRVPTSEFRKRYDACIKADVDVKSGNAKDKAALDALMLTLLYEPIATSRTAYASKW